MYRRYAEGVAIYPQAAQHPTALTIAGFDPSSGAGATADLLTFAAHGIFATAALTATTVQSTRGVFAVHAEDPGRLRETLFCLEEDLPPAGIKIGMLASTDVLSVVAEYVGHVRAQRAVHVVLDPVLRASSGATLLQAALPLAAFQTLFPLVDAITPNLSEAAALTGQPCDVPADMERCAAALKRQYPQLTVLLTGGHLSVPADLLDDDTGVNWFPGEHIATTCTHGTGCAFSTALVAARMQGRSWPAATVAAKRFVAAALRDAVPHGSGAGPMALLPQLGRRAQAGGASPAHVPTASRR